MVLSTEWCLWLRACATLVKLGMCVLTGDVVELSNFSGGGRSMAAVAAAIAAYHAEVAGLSGCSRSFSIDCGAGRNQIHLSKRQTKTPHHEYNFFA